MIIADVNQLHHLHYYNKLPYHQIVIFQMNKKVLLKKIFVNYFMNNHQKIIIIINLEVYQQQMKKQHHHFQVGMIYHHHHYQVLNQIIQIFKNKIQLNHQLLIVIIHVVHVIYHLQLI
jgi:hypothetical protein